MNIFRQNALQAHNAVRRLYNVSDLVLNDKLNDLAQVWSLNQARLNNLKINWGNKYGENNQVICAYGLRDATSMLFNHF